MPFLKPIRISYTKRKIDISKRNGWRHAIFDPRNKLLVKGYYKGEWRDDKKEGKGNQLDRNGFIYEGDWFNGKKHGIGTLSKIYGPPGDGTIRKLYTGQWINGKRNGFGYSWYEDESYYEGNFCQNKRHGYGRMWYCNGDYYEGCWMDDLYNGVGVYVKFNGNRYKGEFVAGKKEGRGVFYHIVTGQKQVGIWVNDLCISGIMSDIYWRQSAPRPTPYPIPRVELAEDNELEYTYEIDDSNDDEGEEETPSPTCKRPPRRIIPNICVSVNRCPCLESVL
ncbi:uncharacterized protein LOC143359998 [Halictus rubicundus]|uniref:uncharacterized protein LOC143359998 n=1 Tax=Halictus rubicundus TaxID=77578 RepID=UPI0040352F55